MVKNELKEYDEIPYSQSSKFKKNEARKWLESFLRTTKMDYQFEPNGTLILSDDSYQVILKFGPVVKLE